MNRNEFISALTKRLGELGVPDIEEIVAEYEQHFEYKLADGHSEEETAARLLKPEEIAMQFASEGAETSSGKGNRGLTAIGLGFADIFAAMLFILLFSWVLVVGAFAIASGATGLCCILGVNFADLIYMPVRCAVLMGVSFLALAVLSGVGTVYCFLFARQLTRAYCRWHKNKMAAAGGKPVYPPLPSYPTVSPKLRRRLRGVALISLTIFAVSFIVFFIVSALAAGALQFWHVWRWFV